MLKALSSLVAACLYGLTVPAIADTFAYGSGTMPIDAGHGRPASPFRRRIMTPVPTTNVAESGSREPVAKKVPAKHLVRRRKVKGTVVTKH